MPIVDSPSLNSQDRRVGDPRRRYVVIRARVLVIRRAVELLVRFIRVHVLEGDVARFAVVRRLFGLQAWLLFYIRSGDRRRRRLFGLGVFCLVD